MSLALYEKIKSNKKSACGDCKGLKYGICEMQGWRNEMEDSYCVFNSKSSQDEWSFFAVFDGHGGGFCSKVSSGIFNTNNLLPTHKLIRVDLKNIYGSKYTMN